MSNLTVLSSLEDQYAKDAALVLEEAADVGFKTVIVLGLKDGQIHIRAGEQALLAVGAYWRTRGREDAAMGRGLT